MPTSSPPSPSSRSPSSPCSSSSTSSTSSATSASAATPRCTRPPTRCCSRPGHLYELLPIAVLIGTIYALARLAQTSQYTILRTGGLGPGRALALLAEPGAGLRRDHLRRRRLPRADQRELRQPAARGVPRQPQARPLGRLDQGARRRPRPASAATRSTSARPSAGSVLRERAHLRVRRRRPAALRAPARPRPRSQRDGTLDALGRRR